MVCLSKACKKSGLCYVEDISIGSLSDIERNPEPLCRYRIKNIEERWIGASIVTLLICVDISAGSG